MSRPEQRVDRYRIEEDLGHRDGCVVYRGRHETLGSVHALKTLLREDPVARLGLLEEGRIQASLRHPNLVGVTDVLDIDQRPILVQEYVDGPHLAAHLEAGALPLEAASSLFEALVAGVAAIHNAGWVHGDLSPTRILVGTGPEGPRPRITGFGSAHGIGTVGEARRRGTPGYQAPEQIREEPSCDERVDLFALGCLLYEITTGHPAFPGDDAASIHSATCSGRYTSPEVWRPDLPPRMAEAIRRSLRVDPAERPADCGELMGLLSGVASAATVPAAPVRQALPGAEPSTHPWRVMSGPLLLLLVLSLMAAAGSLGLLARVVVQRWGGPEAVDPPVVPATAPSAPELPPDPS